MTYFDEPNKTKRISKTEWEVKKKILGSKCIICNKTDKQVGGLIKAHIKARHKSGSEVIPMCSNCHKKYDDGSLSTTQLKKIGLTPQIYKRLIPSKKKKKETYFDGSEVI